MAHPPPYIYIVVISDARADGVWTPHAESCFYFQTFNHRYKSSFRLDVLKCIFKSFMAQMDFCFSRGAISIKRRDAMVNKLQGNTFFYFFIILLIIDINIYFSYILDFC